MATENDFNGDFSSYVRRMGTSFKAVKISDKVKAGISDFLIFNGGRAVAVECKHIQELPEGRGRALKHAVSGPQQTFLKGMALAGVPGFIVIACAGERSVTIIPGSEVPPSGNWTREEIFEARRVHGVYFYKDIPKMVCAFFETPGPLALVG